MPQSGESLKSGMPRSVESIAFETRHIVASSPVPTRTVANEHN
jgi:hypothetical protein